MKTLIVDDVASNQVILKYMLQDYGPCFIADNGQQAIDLFTEMLREGKPFDLVLMDVQMPDIDGLTALKEIRALEKLVYGEEVPFSRYSKIIMVTCNTEPSVVMESLMKLNANAFIPKPVDKKTLLAKLAKQGLIYLP